MVETQSKRPPKLFTKICFKTILDNLTLYEIVGLESLNRQARELIHKTPLHIYLQLQIQTSEYSEFWKLHAFLGWLTRHFSTESPFYPHSIQLNINSYRLKEDLTEYCRMPFLEALSQLLEILTARGYEQLSELKVYLFKQHAPELNDGVCGLLLPLLHRLAQAQNLINLCIDSSCTEAMIQEIVKMECLSELRITNCAYVEGGFLEELKSRNNLRVVDFRGSYHIEFDAIVKCVRNNKKTVTQVHVDGEGVENR
jgi:hypothetical protein